MEEKEVSSANSNDRQRTITMLNAPNRLLLTIAITIAASVVPVSASYDSSIVVDRLPKIVRPYIFPYLMERGYKVGNNVFRVPRNTRSTGGAINLFTEFDSPNLQVIPHWHNIWYGTFYCFRGGDTVYLANETRSLQSGDFGTVPQNNKPQFCFLRA